MVTENEASFTVQSTFDPAINKTLNMEHFKEDRSRLMSCSS